MLAVAASPLKQHSSNRLFGKRLLTNNGTRMNGGTVFTHRLRVTYAHCTLGNHIYYARYLDLLEAARGEFFRQIGFPCAALQEQDTIFQVTECWLKYLKPARYDDELNIEITLSELKKVRVRFDYRITRGSDALVDAWTQMVCASTTEKPKRIPDELVAALSPYARGPRDPEL